MPLDIGRKNIITVIHGSRAAITKLNLDRLELVQIDGKVGLREDTMQMLAKSDA
jgi:hypothetical protein